MKQQKFYHLTFVYQNFRRTFGRNVLEEFLRKKFSIINGKDFSGPLLAGLFEEQHPNINTIFVYECSDYPEATKGINYDRYLILKTL